jgi:DNA-binding transcriptional LysR family regulator
MPRIFQWDRQIGRRLRLSDLFVFFTVVKSGSMTKAAAQLNVATPSVSEIIADLEQTIGVRLLDRSPRGVVLTPYGETLLKYGEAAFDDLRQGVRAIEFLADPTTGELTIGCPESIVATVLPPVVEHFCKKYPRVTVHVDNVPTPALRNPGLRDRKYDLVFARLGRRPLEDVFMDELNVEVLLDDPLVLVSTMQNQWARRRNVKLADLVDQHWILPPSNTWEYGWVAEAFNSRGVSMPKARLVSISIPLRVRLLANGPYITTLVLSVARLNGLKVLSVDLPPWPFPIVVATLKNRTLSPVAERFIECAREVAGTFPGKTEKRVVRGGK